MSVNELREASCEHCATLMNGDFPFSLVLHTFFIPNALMNVTLFNESRLGRMLRRGAQLRHPVCGRGPHTSRARKVSPHEAFCCSIMFGIFFFLF